MYNISDEEIENYLAKSAHRDISERMNPREGIFYKPRADNVISNEIDLRYKPKNMEYGYVEFWNPVDRLKLENVEWHKSNGWGFVLRVVHQELCTVSPETESLFRKDRDESRDSWMQPITNFDNDLIKKPGLVLMQKDSLKQRAYEQRISHPQSQRRRSVDQEVFNNTPNQFNMTMKKSMEEDNGIRYANY